MNLRAEINAPQLAAFGPPVWAYKPVSVMGFQVASAIVVAVVGLVFLALPTVVALVVGGQLNAVHSATNNGAPSSSFTLTEPAPDSLQVAYTTR